MRHTAPTMTCRQRNDETLKQWSTSKSTYATSVFQQLDTLSQDSDRFSKLNCPLESSHQQVEDL